MIVLHKWPVRLVMQGLLAVALTGSASAQITPLAPPAPAPAAVTPDTVPPPTSFVFANSSLESIVNFYARLTNRTLVLPEPLPQNDKVTVSSAIQRPLPELLSAFRVLLALHGVMLSDSTDGKTVVAIVDPAAALQYLQITGRTPEDRLAPVLVRLDKRTDDTPTPGLPPPSKDANTFSYTNITAIQTANLVCYYTGCLVLMGPMPRVHISVEAHDATLRDAVLALDRSLWDAGVALQGIQINGAVLITAVQHPADSVPASASPPPPPSTTP